MLGMEAIDQVSKVYRKINSVVMPAFDCPVCVSQGAVCLCLDQSQTFYEVTRSNVSVKCTSAPCLSDELHTWSAQRSWHGSNVAPSRHTQR